MVFSSMLFLFVFLPIVSLAYFFTLKKLKHRNLLLLISSLIFYAFGEPVYIILMLISIVFNFKIAELIEGVDKTNTQFRKALLVCGVFINLSFLFMFKYEGFVAQIITENLPIRYTSLNLALPIGISFFTFQALSYIIDVYKGTAPAQKSIVNLGLYISFFPQLIAGPIVRYNTIAQQINSRTTTAEHLGVGVKRFIIGLGKKIIFANQFALIAQASFENPSPSFSFAWLGALAYSLQIYYDFSGYSDMAIGLGKIFGFDFLENFNYPYISKSLSDFWRRWHISLGSWFRDYVYFPLGGSRVKKPRLVFNLFIVWLLTGIWHGASWQFIVWGLMYFVILTIEKLLNINRITQKIIPIGIFYRIITFFFVVFGWVIFGESNLTSGIEHLKTMVNINQIDIALSIETIKYLDIYYVLLILGAILATPLLPKLLNLIKQKFITAPAICAVYDVFASCFYMAVFFVCVSYLAMSSHNPFIYFNF